MENTQNIDSIYRQFIEYIKMRKDIKSKMNSYETDVIKKIKGFFLIDKEQLKEWKKSINYSILKFLKGEDQIRAYIKQHVAQKNIEKKEPEYIIDYKKIIEEKKRYKIVKKEFLNFFLKDEKQIKSEDDYNSLSCIFGNEKIIIDFEENKKLICKTKMQGDLIYIILHDLKEEEKNDIIINVLKLVSYKFLKVLNDVPILKGKYTIIRWDQILR